MKTLIKKNKPFGVLVYGLLSLFCLMNTAAGEEAGKADKIAEIRVAADKLVSDRNAQYAEFSGNVVATRENTTLTCSSLKVFYAAKREKTGKKAGDKSEPIEKMVATENVKLVFEDKIAVAEKAVYTAKNDSIVLTGGEPRVTSGNSYITGDKITLLRADGKIIVDRGKTKRVSAEFHPEDEELMKKK